MTSLDRFALVAAHHQGLGHVRALQAVGLHRSTLSRAVSRGRLVRVAPHVLATTPLPAWPRHLVTTHGPDAEFVLHVRAGLLSRAGAVARGRTAACLLGWSLLAEPRGAVETLHPHSTTGPARTRDLRLTLVRPVPLAASLRVTPAVQTALDLAGELPLRQAVAAVDSALRLGHVCLPELLAVRRRGVAGHRAARAVLLRCDPLAGSVLESCARVDLQDAGLEGFVTQYEVRDALGILRVDFCWPGARLVLEVDGARWHPDPARDRVRDNRLAALGFRVIRLTWREVMDDPRWWEQVSHALRTAGHPERG